MMLPHHYEKISGVPSGTPSSFFRVTVGLNRSVPAAKSLETACSPRVGKAPSAGSIQETTVSRTLRL